MEELDGRIAAAAARIDGRIGVCVRDLATGQEIGVNPDEALPMASVCKIPILVAAYRKHDAGNLDLAERVEFTEACRCYGSGLFNAFDPGICPSVHDLLLMMIVVSDNAATDLILDRLTPAGVTQAMRDLALYQILVDRPIRDLIGDILAALDPRLRGVQFRDWEAFKQAHPDIKMKERDLSEARRAVNEAASDRDVASARDIARLCAMVARNEAATPESCAAMVEILEKQQLNGRLPRDLPAFTRFPHKTGTLGSGAVVNDAGVLYVDDEPRAAVAVLSRDVRNPVHQTNAALAEMGSAVYAHYTRGR